MEASERAVACRRALGCGGTGVWRRAESWEDRQTPFCRAVSTLVGEADLASEARLTQLLSFPPQSCHQSCC